MAIVVRENSTKWARNGSSAGPSYKEGTDSPRRAWEGAAIAGEPNYGLGVNQAVANGSFSKGVRKSGQARYDTAINEKGISRFTQAMALPSSKTRYEAGFGPFAAKMRSVDLPPKQPKGLNLERVRLVNDAMIAQKLAA